MSNHFDNKDKRVFISGDVVITANDDLIDKTEAIVDNEKETGITTNKQANNSD